MKRSEAVWAQGLSVVFCFWMVGDDEISKWRSCLLMTSSGAYMIMFTFDLMMAAFINKLRPTLIQSYLAGGWS